MGSTVCMRAIDASERAFLLDGFGVSSLRNFRRLSQAYECMAPVLENPHLHGMMQHGMASSA